MFRKKVQDTSRTDTDIETIHQSHPTKIDKVVGWIVCLGLEYASLEFIDRGEIRAAVPPVLGILAITYLMGEDEPNWIG